MAIGWLMKCLLSKRMSTIRHFGIVMYGSTIQPVVETLATQFKCGWLDTASSSIFTLFHVLIHHSDIKLFSVRKTLSHTTEFFFYYEQALFLAHPLCVGKNLRTTHLLTGVLLLSLHTTVVAVQLASTWMKISDIDSLYSHQFQCILLLLFSTNFPYEYITSSRQGVYGKCACILIDSTHAYWKIVGKMKILRCIAIFVSLFFIPIYHRRITTSTRLTRIALYYSGSSYCKKILHFNTRKNRMIALWVMLFYFYFLYHRCSYNESFIWLFFRKTFSSTLSFNLVWQCNR